MALPLDPARYSPDGVDSVQCPGSDPYARGRGGAGKGRAQQGGGLRWGGGGEERGHPPVEWPEGGRKGYFQRVARMNAPARAAIPITMFQI